MKTLIRAKTFETNSSSSHVFCKINTTIEDLKKEIIEYDDYWSAYRVYNLINEGKDDQISDEVMSIVKNGLSDAEWESIRSDEDKLWNHVRSNLSDEKRLFNISSGEGGVLEIEDNNELMVAYECWKSMVPQTSYEEFIEMLQLTPEEKEIGETHVDVRVDYGKHRTFDWLVENGAFSTNDRFWKFPMDDKFINFFWINEDYESYQYLIEKVSGLNDEETKSMLSDLYGEYCWESPTSDHWIPCDFSKIEITDTKYGSICGKYLRHIFNGEDLEPDWIMNILTNYKVSYKYWAE